MEIAVIGNSEFILGFRLAGIRKTYAAENDCETERQSLSSHRMSSKFLLGATGGHIKTAP